MANEKYIYELLPGDIVNTDIKINNTESIFPLIYCGLSKNDDTALLLSRDLLPPTSMNSYDISRYDGCDLDTFLNGNFKDVISRNLNECLVKTEIEVKNNRYIQRDIFLPSLKEVKEDVEHSFLSALMRYKDSDKYKFARIACDLFDHEQHSYWLRTPYSASSFCCVSNFGSSSGFNATFSGSWLRPCFSVSLDTIVSDEGEDTIIDHVLTYNLIGLSSCERTKTSDELLRNLLFGEV